MAGRRRQFVVVAFVAVIAGATGFAIRGWYLGAPSEPTPHAGDKYGLSQVTLKDLSGTPQRLDQWGGKVLVVNFWATWCAPCRTEIPEFIRMQDRYRDQGLQFVGIAIDQPDKVARFADEVRFNYPVLIGEIDAVEFSRKLGNRLGALPFTAIFDRRGNLARTELGGLDETKLASLIQPLI